jgi:carbonic anhydrase/acetyltransferase-like protein (isoleucine patch superfamily)
VHGATVERGALVGMGATMLNGSRLGAGSILAAGALLPEGKEIPPGVLAAGVPARVVRQLTDEDAAKVRLSAEHYTLLAEEYLRLLET